MTVQGYRPGSYPQIDAGVPTYLTNEFSKIAAALSSLTQNLPPNLAADVAALQATPLNFSAHKNSVDQTLTTTSFTKVTFGTEARDVGGLFDTTNSRWTPPAGLANINGLIRILPTNTQTGVAYHSALFKNGSVFAAGQSLICPSGGSGVMVLGLSFVDAASGTDFYELFAAADSVSAGSLTIAGGPTSTYFQGYMIK